MQSFPKNQKRLFAVAIFLAVAFLALDLSMPLGVAGGVPYVALVLLGWWLHQPRYLILLGAVATVLTFAGYYFSAAGGIEWMVLANRGLALFAIWVTATLLAKAKSSERALLDAHHELRAAQDALLRKERLAALGQLTGTVAHELRNPLGTIANAINVIRHKCADAKPGLEKTLARAERNIERCDTIITELLDFARAKGLQPEPTVVDAWLAEVLEEQHITEAITVTRDFRADAAAVAFDRDELRRAVINLVDNACQAMTGGEKRADSRTADSGTADSGTADSGAGDAGTGDELALSTRMNGKRLEITVSDSGPGIPAEVLPQVLEPLFSTKTFGTGLGLPTVQRIMEAHGGGLEITSKEHCGTKVVLWLPLGQPRDEGAPA